MSNALALGAVTAVLRNLLDNAVVNEKLTAALGPVKVVTTIPKLLEPDKDFVGLNLFLYHVQPNSGWRNIGLPSRDPAGGRISNPPLALDLFYLLSAFGKADFEAEILLGYAMQLFHEMPVLSRDVIRATFQPPAPVVDDTLLPPKFKNLAAADLADQLEQLKISPYSMSSEETSKLWTAMSTSFRPSVAYQVSVVLIESRAASRSVLPVLKVGGPVGIEAQAGIVPAVPTLLGIAPPNKQPAARLNEVVTITGHHLTGITTKAVFRHPRVGALPPVVPGAVSDTELDVTIPNLPDDWPAGIYSVSAVVTKPAGDRTSNELPLALAPVIDVPGTTAARDGITGVLTVNVKLLSPKVLPLQTAALIVGDAEAISTEPRTLPTDTLKFTYPKAVAPPPGDYFIRLRIDGVESIFIDRSGPVPKFDTTQRKTMP